MSRIISFENVKNDSNRNNNSKNKYSNSSICKNTNKNNSKISNPLESVTEENKRKGSKIKKISKININNIINDLNSDYFSKTNEENEQNEENISNYSAKNRRPFKKKKSTIRKINSQTYDSRKGITKFQDDKKNNTEDIDEIEEEQEKRNLRQILDKFFTKQRMAILQLIISTLAFISCTFYVICTYKINFFKYMNYLDILVLICFLLYYLIEITLSHHRILHILSFNSLLQFITMLPAFLAFITDDYLNSFIYMFVNGCRVFRFYRITNGFNYFEMANENNVKKQILMIVNTILNMIFIISGLMQIVERSEIDKLMKIQTDELSILQLKLRKHFHHYIYYTIVSISTVGFGDISPYTSLF